LLGNSSGFMFLQFFCLYRLHKHAVGFKGSIVAITHVNVIDATGPTSLFRTDMDG